MKRSVALDTVTWCRFKLRVLDLGAAGLTWWSYILPTLWFGHELHPPPLTMVICDSRWLDQPTATGVIEYFYRKPGVQTAGLPQTESCCLRTAMAVKDEILGHKRRQESCTLFTPDTILDYRHQLIAMKWNYSGRGHANPGRPRL